MSEDNTPPPSSESADTAKTALEEQRRRFKYIQGWLNGLGQKDAQGINSRIFFVATLLTMPNGWTSRPTADLCCALRLLAADDLHATTGSEQELLDAYSAFNQHLQQAPGTSFRHQNAMRLLMNELATRLTVRPAKPDSMLLKLEELAGPAGDNDALGGIFDTVLEDLWLHVFEERSPVSAPRFKRFKIDCPQLPYLVTEQAQEDAVAAWKPWADWIDLRLKGKREAAWLCGPRVGAQNSEWPPQASDLESIKFLSARLAAAEIAKDLKSDEDEMREHKVPPPSEIAPRFAVGADGRFEILAAPGNATFEQSRRSLLEFLRNELPNYPQKSDAYGDVITHLIRYEAALRSPQIWDIWFNGNVLRKDQETNARRMFNPDDADRPPLPHGLAGMLDAVVDGNNAMIESHPTGRKLDATRPNPAQKAAAPEKLKNSKPILASFRSSPEVIHEITVAAVTEIVWSGEEAQDGGGLGAEQAALIAVNTINNVHQAMILAAAAEINRVAIVDRIELKRLVSEARAAALQQTGPTSPDYWPAFFRELGGRLAGWSHNVGASGVRAISFLVFRAGQISSWLDSNADTVALRASVLRILNDLGIQPK